MACEEHCVTEVIIKQIGSDDSFGRETFALPDSLREVSFANGVRVGMQSEKLFRILGPPPDSRDMSITYEYSGKTPHLNIGDGQAADSSSEINSIIVQIVAGRIVCLRAFKITSD